MYTSFPISLRAGQVGVLRFRAAEGTELGSIEGALFVNDPEGTLPSPMPCVVQDNELYIPVLPAGVHLLEVRLNGRTEVYQHVEVQPSPLGDSMGSAAWDVVVRQEGGVWIFEISAPMGPAGAPGRDGKSAYELWLAAGNSGSEQEFFDSLRGEPGADGEDGVSPSPQEVADALLPMLSTDVAMEGPAASQNWHAGWFQLGEVYLPRRVALTEFGYRCRFDSMTGCTTDPVYLGIWERSEDGSTWELRGVSLNTQVQGTSVDVIWRFDAPRTRLNGRPIRCCLLASREDAWRTDLTIGVRTSYVSDADTQLHYNGQFWHIVPKYFLRGYQTPEMLEGPAGEPGMSAYEVWLAAGNSGSEQEFLNSLRGAPGAAGSAGPQGVPGKEGASAYEVWLAAGNEGSEQDFLESLRGEPGAMVGMEVLVSGTGERVELKEAPDSEYVYNWVYGVCIKLAAKRGIPEAIRRVKVKRDASCDTADCDAFYDTEPRVRVRLLRAYDVDVSNYCDTSWEKEVLVDIEKSSIDPEWLTVEMKNDVVWEDGDELHVEFMGDSQTIVFAFADCDALEVAPDRVSQWYDWGYKTYNYDKKGWCHAIIESASERKILSVHDKFDPESSEPISGKGVKDAIETMELGKGENGQDGLSAYELAVKEGYKGSLEDWLASLQGAPGRDGRDGQNGRDGKDGKDGEVSLAYTTRESVPIDPTGNDEIRTGMQVENIAIRCSATRGNVGILESLEFISAVATSGYVYGVNVAVTQDRGSIEAKEAALLEEERIDDNYKKVRVLPREPLHLKNGDYLCVEFVGSMYLYLRETYDSPDEMTESYNTKVGYLKGAFNMLVEHAGAPVLQNYDPASILPISGKGVAEALQNVVPSGGSGDNSGAGGGMVSMLRTLPMPPQRENSFNYYLHGVPNGGETWYGVGTSIFCIQHLGARGMQGKLRELRIWWDPDVYYGVNVYPLDYNMSGVVQEPTSGGVTPSAAYKDPVTGWLVLRFDPALDLTDKESLAIFCQDPNSLGWLAYGEVRDDSGDATWGCDAAGLMGGIIGVYDWVLEEEAPLAQHINRIDCHITPMEKYWLYYLINKATRQ